MFEGARILIVDDEEDIIEFLTYNLEKEGYQTKSALDGQLGLQIAEEFNPHLIILDVMMPKMDGIEVCQRLRAKPEFANTVIVFLTARHESFTQVSAFENGGDDFITKPIKLNVFKARIMANLRRHGDFSKTQIIEQLIHVGKLEINPEQYKVSLDGNDIILAKKEFELLLLLASKPGKVFKRDEIMDKVWGSDVIVGDRTIDVHIRKLREKLGDEYISTLKGVGYKIDF